MARRTSGPFCQPGRICHYYTQMTSIQTLASTRGATIGYQTVGAGPAVIVIPGALSTAADFETFANALAANFAVHTLERRGRGRSSPQNAEYCMEIEREDVRVLQAHTQAAYLFGHSYGGRIALEAARNNALVKKVAAYEPGISVNGSIPTTWATRYERLIAQNQRLAAFVEFSRGAGPHRARTTPRWLLKLLLPIVMKRHDLQQKLGLLESNLREHQEIARLDNADEAFGDISAAVLVMVGGKSDLPWVATAVEKLTDTLPDVRVEQFPTLNHFGPDQSGPAEVAETVTAFFNN